VPIHAISLITTLVVARIGIGNTTRHIAPKNNFTYFAFIFAYCIRKGWVGRESGLTTLPCFYLENRIALKDIGFRNWKNDVMGNKKLPKSVKIYIRKEKARIRREIFDTQKQKELIKKIYQDLQSVGSAKGHSISN